MQRSRADARVVGEGGQPGRGRRVARLRERVLQEGEVRLLRRRHVEFRLGDRFPPEGREQVAELAKLAGVSGGDDDAAIHEAGVGLISSGKCLGSSSNWPPEVPARTWRRNMAKHASDTMNHAN